MPQRVLRIGPFTKPVAGLKSMKLGSWRMQRAAKVLWRHKQQGLTCPWLLERWQNEKGEQKKVIPNKY